MANVSWEGDATAVAQVETFTLNDDFNDSETDVTITMTAEDGSTQTVSITPTGVDESVIAAALQAALNSSTETLFTAVTWTVATTVVTGTAKEAGVPFYAASSVTGGTGTITDNVSTASAGPNDWNTGANWSGGSAPSTNDDVLIGTGSSILYGLQKSGLTLTSLRVGSGFTGTLGDPTNRYAFDITATDVTIDTSGAWVGIGGTVSGTLNVRGLPAGSEVLVEADVERLIMSGSRCRGLISVEAGPVDEVYQNGCPNARTVISSGISGIEQVDMDSGTIENSSRVTTAPGTVSVNGGTYRQVDGTGVTQADIRGRGVVYYDTDGTLTTANLRGGTLSFKESSHAAVTVSTLNNAGGTLDTSGGTTVTISTNNEWSNYFQKS